MDSTTKKGPKQLPELSAEQLKIKDDFMHLWHETLPKNFGAMEIFNQNYPRRAFKIDVARKASWRTLEIGGGLGSHIPFEDLTNQNYTVLELRANMLDTLVEKYPNVNAMLADAQQTYAPPASFDRIIAIHVLEHLPNLPECIRQMHRVLVKDGVAHVVIPCEGSLAYSVCRKISAERLFKKTFHMDYNWLIKTEHINLAVEIIEELKKYFIVKRTRFFPFPVPFQFCNIAIGMTLYPRTDVDSADPRN